MERFDAMDKKTQSFFLNKAPLRCLLPGSEASDNRFSLPIKRPLA